MAIERKRSQSAEGGAPAWVVTYGDMMSLLLTFFILIISFSTISKEGFEEAAGSMKGAFGVMPEEAAVVKLWKDRQIGREEEKYQAVEQMARELKRRLQVQGREQDVKVKYDKQGGLKITLPSSVLFDTARAELRPESLPVLTDVAELLTEMPDAFIEVRGHTDVRPLISTHLYRDNHELSFARAMSVTRHFTDVGGLSLERFEVIACGPSQPVVTNDTEEGMQANRRVEIYVRARSVEGEEAAPGTRQGGGVSSPAGT
jgi:chemotaxis protein MotB